MSTSHQSIISWRPEVVAGRAAFAVDTAVASCTGYTDIVAVHPSVIAAFALGREWVAVYSVCSVGAGQPVVAPGPDCRQLRTVVAVDNTADRTADKRMDSYCDIGIVERLGR